jgi:hypothetical protein
VSQRPALIQPMPRKWNMDELEKVIPKSYGARIPEMYQEWWTVFHSNTRKYIEVGSGISGGHKKISNF